jgi:hypothetical protein
MSARVSPWKFRIGDRVVMRVEMGRAGGRLDVRPGLVIDVGGWGVVVAWDNVPTLRTDGPAYIDPAFLAHEGDAP